MFIISRVRIILLRAACKCHMLVESNVSQKNLLLLALDLSEMTSALAEFE